jgi:hypothetical protein
MKKIMELLDEYSGLMRCRVCGAEHEGTLLRSRLLGNDWAEHSVTCFGCGKTVTDSQRTKTAIRKQLRQEGWKVSVQGWDYKRLDFCGQECFEHSFEKLGEEYHRAEMKEALFDFVPPGRPN